MRVSIAYYFVFRTNRLGLKTKYSGQGLASATAHYYGLRLCSTY